MGGAESFCIAQGSYVQSVTLERQSCSKAAHLLSKCLPPMCPKAILDFP